MGMGDVKYGIKEIFDRPISDGDFLVGMSGRGDISQSEFMIYTPYKTKFIINPYLFPYEKEKRINVYENLDYSCFIENNLSYNKCNCYCKLEALDEIESYIYNIFKICYDKRMQAVSYYNKIKDNLPVGSIVSDRNTYNPLIYLGKASKYIILREDESLGIKNIYSIQNKLEDYHIYAELDYKLDKKFDLNDIYSNKINIKDIMTELSSLYFLKVKKGIPENQYYLGFIDVYPLLGDFNSDDYNVYNDSNSKNLQPLNLLYNDKNNCMLFTYASNFKILIELDFNKRGK